jgi:hypothetical protein
VSLGPTVAGSPNAAELETTQRDAAFYGTPAHGRQANCRGFQARSINAVVVRAWQGRDYGPSGKPVFRTIAAVGKPWRSFNDYNDRRLVEHWLYQGNEAAIGLGPRAVEHRAPVQLHVLLTRLCPPWRPPIGCGLVVWAAPAPAADPEPVD